MKKKKEDKKNKLTKHFIIILIIGWFGISWAGLIYQLVQTQKLTSQLIGFSDDEKREALFGKFYQFLEFCRERTPADAKIFLTNPTQFYYFFSSYYLYPRRVLVASPDQVINGPEIEKINKRRARPRMAVAE